jgi:hypothetical protein
LNENLSLSRCRPARGATAPSIIAALRKESLIARRRRRGANGGYAIFPNAAQLVATVSAPGHKTISKLRANLLAAALSGFQVEMATLPLISSETQGEWPNDES